MLRRILGGANDRALAEVAPSRHLIDLRAVVKDYVTDAGSFRALRGVDLQVGPGEFIAIVGKSGCGKSTLMNMMTGIDRPTAGDVMGGRHRPQPACPRARPRSGAAAPSGSSSSSSSSSRR